MQGDKYQILNKKIEEFIQKYYLNKIIKGSILGLSIILAYFLLIIIAEYFNYFNSTFRFAILLSFAAISLLILVKLVLDPFLKLKNFGKRINDFQAAKLIGTHFKEIDDKLLNTLQLTLLSHANNDLLVASVEQRINKLRFYNFSTVINLKLNTKYIKYFALPFLVLLLLSVSKPEIIFKPTSRIINFNQDFEKPAPFSICIKNKELKTFQNEDFTLEIKIEGNETPDELFIDYNNTRFRLNKSNKSNFNYKFHNLQKSLVFNVLNEDFRSKEYTLEVLPNPQIVDFTIELNFPAYTKKTKEVLQNAGDIIIPKGTEVCWFFATKNTEELNILNNGEHKKLSILENGKVSFQNKILKSTNYAIFLKNKFAQAKDTLQFTVNAINDRFPNIIVNEFKDSSLISNIFFRGEINDDYGFSQLRFIAKKINSNDTIALKTINIPLESVKNQQLFFYDIDLMNFNINPGEELLYYFEIWDNDEIDGHKHTKTENFYYKLPTKEELEEENDAKNEELKRNLQRNLAESNQIKEEIESLNKKLLDKKELNWQDQNKLKDLIKKQQEIIKETQNFQKENELKLKREAQYKEEAESILKKQEQLEKLYKELLNPELLDMLKKLEEMLNTADKEKIKEAMDKLKLENKEIEKQIDRNLALFKELEFQKKLDETIKKLAEVAKEQEKLFEKTLEKNNATEEIKDEQKKIDEMFKQAKDDLNEMRKLNQNLEFPNILKETTEQENSIQQDINKATEELSKNKAQKAAQSQKSAAEKMQKLADEMEKMQQELEEENEAEDISKLRELLENLIKTSFNQEEMINLSSKTTPNNPSYNSLMTKQKKIADDLKMIEDSLYALSKRQPQIQTIVNTELGSINQQMIQVLDFLHKRNPAASAGKQQFIMTNVNNLALLLAESLKDMQNNMNMKNQSQCKSNCSKPGGKPKPGNGKPSFKNMREMQEKLNKEMQEMMNGKKQGKDGENGKPSMSEKMARMAAEQEEIRNQLQKMQDELKKDGLGTNGDLQKMAKEMEKSETEMVNKILSPETMKRQQEILTRLLESEKAEQMREMEEKRESNEAKNYKYSNPNNFLEYKRIIGRDKELLKYRQLDLKPYYKEKVENYLYKIED